MRFFHGSEEIGFTPSGVRSLQLLPNAAVTRARRPPRSVTYTRSWRRLLYDVHSAWTLTPSISRHVPASGLGVSGASRVRRHNYMCEGNSPNSARAALVPSGSFALVGSSSSTSCWGGHHWCWCELLPWFGEAFQRQPASCAARIEP